MPKLRGNRGRRKRLTRPKNAQRREIERRLRLNTGTNELSSPGSQENSQPVPAVHANNKVSELSEVIDLVDSSLILEEHFYSKRSRPKPKGYSSDSSSVLKDHFYSKRRKYTRYTSEERLQPQSGPSPMATKCFVCDERIKGKAIRLVMGRTPYSKATLPSKIAQLVGDDFMVVVCMEDVICMRCAGLLNHLDKLETDLKVVRHTLTGYLTSKYPINNKETNAKFDKGERKEKEKPPRPTLTPTPTPAPAPAPAPSPAPVESVKKMRKQYRCELCDFTTTDKNGVAVHAEECTRLPRGCSLCPKRFATVQDHAQHAVLVHNLTWSCQVCSALFSSHQDVADHMKSHPQCSVCNTSFADQVELETHTRTEHEDLRPPSRIAIKQETDIVEACLEELSNDHEAKPEGESLLEADANGIEFHTCSICALTFLKASLYKEHMKMHQQTNSVAKSEDSYSRNPVTNVNESVSRVEEELEDLFEELHSESSPKLPNACEKMVAVSTPAPSGLTRISVTTNHKTSLEKAKKVVYVDSSKESYVIGRDRIQASDGRGHIEDNAVGSNISLPGLAHETTPQSDPSGSSKIQCSECDFSTAVPAALKRHLKMHKSRQREQCCVCPKSFLSKHKLETHVESHVAQGDAKCSVCGHVLSGQEALVEHCREHPAPKNATVKCRFCPRTFATRRSAASHEETHTDVFVFACACANCDRRFQSEEELSQHEARLHRTDPHCRFCGKEIDDPRALRNHENRHASDDFECTVCHRVFKTKTGLRHHSAIHTGDFKYCCDFCGRGFMSRMMLEEHRSRHTKEERYVCDVCGRKFVFQSTYWIHRKWHDNPYPYKCNFCGRLFRHTSLLAVHKRKHTGERPYKCPHCPLTFPVGGTLKRHLILHTGAYPFVCDACNRGFTTKDKYSSHRAKVHGDYELVNRKAQAKEYKMVVHETTDNEPQMDPMDSWELVGNVALDQVLDINDRTSSPHGSESIVVDSTSMTLAGEDGSTATRVVEIVMDESYQAVATVTLAEIAGGNSRISDVWYQ